MAKTIDRTLPIKRYQKVVALSTCLAFPRGQPARSWCPTA